MRVGVEFGHLPDISRVEFRLPPDDPESVRVLAGAKGRNAGRVPRAYVGAPIWSVKEWVGNVYPAGARSADFLKHYSRQFNSIELNTTFYRIPDLKTIDHWREVTPSGFKFCPKLYQDISHGVGMLHDSVLIRGFCEFALLLGDRLGTCFLQLPPHLEPASGLGILDRFFRKLPESFPLAVEFRHREWFSRGALIRDAAALLERHGVATVITDVAGRRDASHASLTAPRVLVRFVGNELHRTDYERADAWAERLSRWLAQGLDELYFFVHQPDNALAPGLISAVIEKFNSRCGLSLADWKRQETQTPLFG